MLKSYRKNLHYKCCNILFYIHQKKIPKCKIAHSFAGMLAPSHLVSRKDNGPSKPGSINLTEKNIHFI